MREAGYYWVKLYKENNWEPAEWAEWVYHKESSNSYGWLIPSSIHGNYEDNELFAIGPRLLPPAEEPTPVTVEEAEAEKE